MNLSGSVSSQYLTALLMAAPLAIGDGGIEIRITDALVSQPYVDMTVRLMERFGVQVCCVASSRLDMSSRMTTAASLTMSTAEKKSYIPRP